MSGGRRIDEGLSSLLIEKYEAQRTMIRHVGKVLYTRLNFFILARARVSASLTPALHVSYLSKTSWGIMEGGAGRRRSQPRNVQAQHHGE